LAISMQRYAFVTYFANISFSSFAYTEKKMYLCTHESKENEEMDH
jgi:hypothetical protein